MGLVEISGSAKRDILLRGPFTQEDCVAYKYKIEQYEKRDKSNRWITIVKGDSFTMPFFVDDGSGQVMIVPAGAEFILKESFEFTNG